MAGRQIGGGQATGPASVPDGSDNEEEMGGRAAFLFEAGDLCAATLDESGANLPDDHQWRLVRSFTLGIRDVGVAGMSPEGMIRGILANGYHIWRTTDPSRTSATTQ